MKNLSHYFIFYTIIFVLLLLLFLCSLCIPKKDIQSNSIKSIKYENNHFINNKSYKTKKFLYFDDGDVRYSEMLFLVDHKKPVRSLIEMNSYLSGNIEEIKGGNYSCSTYYRYWHGPIMYLRPMMLFTNFQIIYFLQMIVLIIVSLIFLLLLIKIDRILGLSFIVTFFMFSLYSIYNNISYFNCYLISVFISIIMLLVERKNKYYSLPYIFIFAGLITSFFDFFTMFLLTISFPLTILVFIRKKRKKSIYLKELINYFLIWLVSYIIPFLIKWIIVFCFFDRNIFTNILDMIKLEVYNKDIGFNIVNIFNINSKLIIPFYYLNYYYYLLIPVVIFSFLNLLNYLDKNIRICFIFIIVICILRLLLVPTQSVMFSFSTFRELIPIYIILLYVLFKQMYNIILKFKK